MHTPRIRLTTLVGTAIVLALALVACSDGDGDGGGGSGSAEVGARSGSFAAQGVAQGPTRDGAAPAPGITVQGTGRVSGQPDTLTATVGVEVERPDVQAALDAARAGAQRVIDAVVDAGVAEEDVQTAEFDVHPRYEEPSRGSPPAIRGYLVRNLVEVKVREIDRAGQVLAAATEAGGEDARVRGVRFSLEDNTQLVAQARDRAFADARSRAEQYAQLAGRGLGALVSVEETTTPSPPAARFAEGGEVAGDAATTSVPIQPGQQEVRVRVTAVWSMD